LEANASSRLSASKFPDKTRSSLNFMNLPKTHMGIVTTCLKHQSNAGISCYVDNFHCRNSIDRHFFHIVSFERANFNPVDLNTKSRDEKSKEKNLSL
jgi:hypothetical protein